MHQATISSHYVLPAALCLMLCRFNALWLRRRSSPASRLTTLAEFPLCIANFRSYPHPVLSATTTILVYQDLSRSKPIRASRLGTWLHAVVPAEAPARDKPRRAGRRFRNYHSHLVLPTRWTPRSSPSPRPQLSSRLCLVDAPSLRASRSPSSLPLRSRAALSPAPRSPSSSRTASATPMRMGLRRASSSMPSYRPRTSVWTTTARCGPLPVASRSRVVC